jgi:hypothetical protein
MDSHSKGTNVLAKLFFGAIALIAVPLYTGGKNLIEKALDGFWGWLLAVFIGLPASIAGGIFAGNWVGWQSYPAVEAWFQSWIPGGLWGAFHFLLPTGWAVTGVLAGALAFWLLFTYAWSILYLLGIKWVVKLTGNVRKFLHQVAHDHFREAEKSFLDVVKTVFQPSSLWSSVQTISKEKHPWADWLIGAVGYLSMIVGTVYLGWVTLTGVHGALAGALSFFAWVPAFLVAYFVVFTVGPLLFDLMDQAHLSFTALICGGATAYALAPLTSLYASVPARIGFLIFVAEALAVVAYIFPAVYLLLSGGLIKKIAEAVRKLFDTVLDEKRTNFRRLFHEVVTLATVYRFTTLSLALWALIGLPSGWAVALAVLVGALTYVLVGELLDIGSNWSVGNTLIGLVAAGHVAGTAGQAYAAHHFVFGAWGAIVAGVVVFLASFCVAYPLLYKGFRFVFDLTGLSALGVPLSWLHEKVWNRFRSVMKRFEKVYERGYWDDRKETNEGNYRKLFLHAVNLLVSPVAGFALGTVASHALGLVPLLTIPVGIALGFLFYLVLGQVILKGGTYFVGVVAGIVGGSTAGAYAYSAVALTTTAQKLSVAVPVGLMGWCAAFFFLFPAAYIVLRLGGTYATSSLLPILGGFYDACWKVFDRLVGQPFLAVYRFVRDYIWLPVWHLAVKVWSAVWSVWLSIWNGVKDAWDSMFGRKNRA